MEKFDIEQVAKIEKAISKIGKLTSIHFKGGKISYAFGAVIIDGKLEQLMWDASGTCQRWIHLATGLRNERLPEYDLKFED